MITALEFNGQIAAGESARDAQGAHGGFGAGVNQTHHLHGRNDVRDQLREFHLLPGGSAEAGSDLEDTAKSLDHRQGTVP